MSISSKLDRVHLKARQNKWLWFFAIFNRLVLALGFLPSGFVKVRGERFTALANNHPMGSYLEAFYHTGYYYTFVGLLQMTAAILLLIPRTATLGAILYFPIILNICILSFAVRFDGSLLAAPLMVLANLYLLCWDWHRLKFIFFKNPSPTVLPSKREMSYAFPLKFFAGVVATVFAVVLVLIGMNHLMFMPRSSASACTVQCEDTDNPAACIELCHCIHTAGRSLMTCLKESSRAPAHAPTPN